MKRLTRVDEDGTVLCIGCVEEEECNEDCLSCQHDIDAIEKLAEYEDLEEQGKLIILPCKVGDTVYGIVEHANGKLEIVDSILYGIEQILQFKDVIGKGLYLTKEEAEQALAKMKEV